MPHILTVCTGNICRSPAAEIALRRHLGDAITTSSAGTRAVVGRGVPEQMAREMAADGLDASTHVARQFTAALAQEADLVIALAAEHRRLLVSEAPLALKKSFLLMELAAMARSGAPLEGEGTAERVANIAQAVIAYRPQLAALDIGDVPDPYGRKDQKYAESFAMIRDAVNDIAAWVRG